MEVLKSIVARHTAPESSEAAPMTDEGLTLRSSYQQTRNIAVKVIWNVDLSIWRKGSARMIQLEQMSLSSIPRWRNCE
jgi:hypothetical protein